MLCSVCHKNVAVIFTKKIDGDKSSTEGLCYKCAKERGINPVDLLVKQANLSEDELKDLTSQFEGLFNDISGEIGDVDYDMADGTKGGIPLGSIFSNIFGANQNEPDEKFNDNNRKKVKTERRPKERRRSFLDMYGTNLTNKASKNELDMVIGRNTEIERVIQILNRRSKNNPCLIGEPGVGKTAIANGLAIKIANKEVPAKLLNKQVYLLDMTAIIAGTQFRGQFEARMKAIIDECKQAKNIILVIDEIHNIIGAGDAEHSMNAANILKPSLASGEVQLVGTTTLKEYRKYIEKDSALERRFQPVLVEEPNVEASIEILKGIKKYYEDFHKVVISNDVIAQTVRMSEKYIHDRFLPDKAIDVLDEACSKINLGNKALYELEILNNRLAKIQEEKEDAVESDSIEDYQKAADLKTEECNILDKIDEINKNLKPSYLTVQDIAEVIERITKIPVSKITEAETQKLLNLEANLHNRVIGQDKAVSSVARAIRRSRAGLQSSKRPPSFIFVGPTGVGKTELAKTLAYEIKVGNDTYKSGYYFVVNIESETDKAVKEFDRLALISNDIIRHIIIKEED